MDPLARKKQYFYENGADATLHFQNGESIPVNRHLLAFHSQRFTDIFFNPTPKSDISIIDFDPKSFKKFLDCLLGFDDYSVSNALIIYPIAFKYNVDSSLKGCLKVLQPPNHSNEMNENVILILNLALLYDCDSLIDGIMMFLRNKFGILNLFERDDYFMLLEPSSMTKVLNCIVMRSYFLEKVYKWAENYLKKQNVPVDTTRSFLEKNRILPLNSLNIFESVQAIFEFHENISRKKLYTSDEILYYLKGNVLKRLWRFPNKSQWVKINKGDIFEEKINFKKFLSLATSNVRDATLKIWRNEMIFDDLGKFTELKLENKRVIVHYEWYYSYIDETHGNFDSCNELNSRIYLCTGYSGCIGRKSYCEYKFLNFKHRISSVNVKYTFNVDCRILKTSLDIIPFAVDDNELYYTCGAEFC